MDGDPEYGVGRLGLGEATSMGSGSFRRATSPILASTTGFLLAPGFTPKGGKGGAIVSRTLEVPQEAGYSLLLDQGKVQLNLVVRWLDDALRIETAESLAPDQWHHVMATYDGSRVARGVSIYVDGKPAKLKVLLDELNQQFKSAEPFRIAFGRRPGEPVSWID